MDKKTCEMIDRLRKNSERNLHNYNLLNEQANIRINKFTKIESEASQALLKVRKRKSWQKSTKPFDFNESNFSLECQSSYYMFPKGMTYTDGFKVLSYLRDYINKELNLDKEILNSIVSLDNVINLSEFGFTKTQALDSNCTMDRQLLFLDRVNQYSKYPEWYIEKISLEDVVSIYNKIGESDNRLQSIGKLKALHR